MWHGAEVLYETQLEILRLLLSLSRLYAAAVLSLPPTRTLESSRLVTCAAMAAVADRMIRLRATDIPSLLCLHMEAAAPLSGAFHQQPFGIDVGAFVVVTEDMLFHDAQLCACRSMVLEYFTGQRARVADDHVIFGWEHAPDVGPCAKLVEQMRLEIGFPKEDEALYVAGTHSDLLDLYPEFEAYRDIVFLFKYMSCWAPGAEPVVKQWTHKDARLAWKAEHGRLSVRAFGKELRLELPPGMAGAAGERRSFFQMLFQSSRPRSSVRGGADPSSLCNAPVHNEEDILHVKELPSFDGRLSQVPAPPRPVAPRPCARAPDLPRLADRACAQSASELLLSYLTVPYIRIPLVVNFFASSEHVRPRPGPRLPPLRSPRPGARRAHQRGTTGGRAGAPRPAAGTGLGAL
jgi:hypothetical protein